MAHSCGSCSNGMIVSFNSDGTASMTPCPNEAAEFLNNQPQSKSSSSDDDQNAKSGKKKKGK